MPRSETWQEFRAVGVLERDPDIRALSNGTSVANLNISTEGGYKDKSGEWKSKREFHKVAVFGQSAQQFAGAAVGTLVFVAGQVETRSYESNGEKKYVTEIKADRIHLLGPSQAGASAKRTESAPARSAPPPQTRAAAAPAPRASAPSDDPFGDGTGITDSDLPGEMW